MSVQLVVSDALKRRVGKFDQQRFAAFQSAAVDVVKGRATGTLAHTSALSGRQIYMLETMGYSLYYSLDPKQPGPVVFEEFLSKGEEDLVIGLFGEGSD